MRLTEHAWEDRGEVDARVVFVLVDEAFSAALLAALPDDVTERVA